MHVISPCPSINLFNLVRRGLRPAARTSLGKAIATGQSVRHDALAIEVNGERQLVDLVVEPVPDSEAGVCVFAFIDRSSEAIDKRSKQAQSRPIAALEKELTNPRTA